MVRLIASSGIPRGIITTQIIRVSPLYFTFSDRRHGHVGVMARDSIVSMDGKWEGWGKWEDGECESGVLRQAKCNRVLNP